VSSSSSIISSANDTTM